MKKLIFAALVAVVAVSAHANTLQWGVNATTGTLDPTKFANATAYLMYSASAISVPTSTDKASYSTSDLTAGSQLASGTMTGGEFSGSNLIDTLSGKHYYYMAVISSDGKYMAISTTTKTANMSTSTANTALKWSTAQFKTYGGVPEPTSGLLMLVGLGALALRRRRA